MMMTLLHYQGVFLLFLISGPQVDDALPSTIKIGGLFDVTDTVEEVAFRYAVDAVNNDPALLPDTRLTAQMERIPLHDSFYASKQVCRALSSGVAALFGPRSGGTSSHVQSICDTLEVPHIETRWDYKIMSSGSSGGPKKVEAGTRAGVNEVFSLNLHPSPASLAKAYVDLILTLEWQSCLILYEESEGLVRLQEVLKISPKLMEMKLQIRQLIAGPNKDYRPLLKDIKNYGETRIVLDCAPENVYEILRQAQQVGITSAYHTYLITTLDLQMIELEDFKHSGTNITGFRLIDPLRGETQRVVQEWMRGEMRFGASRFGTKNTPGGGMTISPNSTVDPFAVSTDTALIYDAVQVFARALSDLDISQHISVEPVPCDGGHAWQHGNSLLNYMKMIEMEGLTGKIKFDSSGFRSDFQLDIIELTKDGLEKVGFWSLDSGANFTRNFTQMYTDLIQSLHNTTLVVTTILTEPYTMYKEDKEVLTGNDQFEGYNIDLIAAISEILGFNYTIRLVEDGAYGSKDSKTGEWNGMIGELLNRKADLAVADLTITYEREQGVDFTTPFMNLGVTILYTKPTAKPPNIFSFLSPLSLWVWIYIMTAYIVSSLLLYFLARLSPYERGVDDLPANNGASSSRGDEKGSRLARADPLYESLFGRAINNQAAVIDRPDSIDNSSNGSIDTHDTFTLLNSFWFMIASLLQQGTDLLPRSLSTRMVAGMWWFFTLIMISSYTANLAAFLTVERMDYPIESAEDLSKQHSIKYGCLGGGSTASFFRDSKIDTYSRMWVFMDSDKSNFVSSNALGVERVLHDNGKYAFLMESTSVEYVIERNCELDQVGGLLDSKGYGIALPPNSPYRTPISSAILQLQEGGKLHILKEKWWKQRKGGGQCEEAKDGGAANELSLKNVGGVFLVLVIGLVISLIVACSERCWFNMKARKAKPLRAPPPPKSQTIPSAFTAETLTDANTMLNSRASHLKNNGHVMTGVEHHSMCHQLGGSAGHLSGEVLEHHPPGSFLTSSLSAAALNQASCAVPSSSMHHPAHHPHSHLLHKQGSLCSTPGGPGAAGGWDHHVLHHQRRSTPGAHFPPPPPQGNGGPGNNEPRCPAHCGVPESDFKYSDDEHTS